MDSLLQSLQEFDKSEYVKYCSRLVHAWEAACGKPFFPFYTMKRIACIDAIGHRAFVVAFIHTYGALLSLREKALFNEFLNGDRPLWRAASNNDVVSLPTLVPSRALVESLFCYDPDAPIVGQTTAKEIWLSAAPQSLCDEEFLANVFYTAPRCVPRRRVPKESDILLHRPNPFFCFGEPNSMRRGVFTVHLWHQQLCCTERRQFDVFAATLWRQASLGVVRDPVKGLYFALRDDSCAAKAIDVQVFLQDAGNLNETKRSLLHELTSKHTISVDGSEHKSTGALDWFLFELHGSALRRQLQLRAARLAFLLRMRCGVSQHNSDAIVSVALLQANRYAAALLYRHAPCAFREWLLRFRVPVYLPLMVPLESYGNFPCRSLSVRNWPAETLPLNIEFQPVLTKYKHEFEQSVLRYRIPPTSPIVHDTHQPDGQWYSSHEFNVGFAAGCLLVCTPHQVERIGVYYRDALNAPKKPIVESPGHASLMHRDASGNYWYSVSLKEFTTNRDALFYQKESAISVDPLIEFARFDFTSIVLHWSRTVKRDIVAAVSFYFRCFNVMRRDGHMTGWLFIDD